ncbi:MAG: hypothetical protein J0I48_19090 [Devosia sp.]|uniref:hypothetical protein n=1 Tax=Devosia sp. 66-22 TaxID=1895753 RepID=UPI00092AE133|nr:hypothetical protein [Devosia sp. 66-22]MBN9348272.1 hypothetical protein [Devosia sp.]OJX48987.1 MAG: hypothetical protein BGO81_10355 [Devosia sp. 66-22]
MTDPKTAKQTTAPGHIGKAASPETGVSTEARDISQMDLEAIHALFHEAEDRYGPSLAEAVVARDKEATGLPLPGGATGSSWDWIKSGPRKDFENEPKFRAGVTTGFTMALSVLSTQNRLGMQAAFEAKPEDYAGRHVEIMETALLDCVCFIIEAAAVSAYVTKALKVEPNSSVLQFGTLLPRMLHGPFMALAAKYVAARDGEKTATRH